MWTDLKHFYKLYEYMKYHFTAAVTNMDMMRDFLDAKSRIFMGGKGRPARKANNFTAIYEPIV
jgi:hypothetical protein